MCACTTSFWSLKLLDIVMVYLKHALHRQGYCPSVIQENSPFNYFSLTGRGGQSALRFARLRMEKRHNYVRKVAEVAVQMFITNDKVNVSGLVLAGSADFKTELSQSDMFDLVYMIPLSF